jgi:hypothetical protein
MPRQPGKYKLYQQSHDQRIHHIQVVSPQDGDRGDAKVGGGDPNQVHARLLFLLSSLCDFIVPSTHNKITIARHNVFAGI